MTQMRPSRSRPLLAGLLALLCSCLAGCGVGVDVPKEPPSTAEIKSWSDHRIALIEKAIREKDLRLPSRVKGLIRYLRSLRINLTVGPGQKFENAAEATGAIDAVVLKLEGWFESSLGRREGDSDEDRAQLQAILDEVKEVLQNVNVREKSP